MKIKNTLIYIFLVILAISIGTSCNHYQKKDIFDNNSRIVREGDSYSYKDRIGEIDSSSMDLDISGFYGCDTIWYIESNGDNSISLDYNVELIKGRLKLVIISPENKIIKSINKTGSYDINLIEGTSRVKIVGDNAKGTINTSIKYENNIVIKSNNRM